MCAVADTLRAAWAILGPLDGSPELDAELLLAHVLNRGRSFLHAHPEAVLNALQRRQYKALLERRARGEPLAYILGVKEFWSLPVRITPDVLIPRPETELLVDLALARIPQQGVFEIADLGTGSGAIALAIASERPHSQVTATDISEAALDVAADNARRLGLTNIRFLAGDWFAPLIARFHVIVSNPPYVAAADPHLQSAVLQYEPRAALMSKTSGLADLSRIVQGASAFLRPGGSLIVEHGFEQGAAARELFERSGYCEVGSHHDLAGQERITLGLRRRDPNSADTHL